MTPGKSARLAALAAFLTPASLLAADIVIAPPATGGVSITNAAGSTTRLRVGDDGIVTIPGLGSVPVPATGLCVEVATGRLGTCAMGGAGTVTSILAGAGLTGGLITTSGSIALEASQLLPTAPCNVGQVPKWGGTNWICAADATGSGAVTEVTASAPLFSSGGAVPNLSLGGGSTGQLLAWTAGGPAFTESPSISGILTLPAASSTTAGTIFKGATRFISNPGNNNTFLGLGAGTLDTSGFGNVGAGELALGALTSGSTNAAFGLQALQANRSGSGNTALGSATLFNNDSGGSNTAIGSDAMMGNITGEQNTAVGAGAMFSNASGNLNTALGNAALSGNVSGFNNIVIGYNAGQAIVLNSNIIIGNAGQATDSGRIRIGTTGSHSATHIAGIRGVTTDLADAIPVVVSSTGQLGTASSSRRVKEDIADMDAASDVLMQLRPVTFRYRSQAASGQRALQYGLVAEEVAQVAPGLAVRSADGSIETVNYPALVPMLLNEVQKQQRTIDTQRGDLDALRAEMADLKRALGLAR